jgi:alpha-1,6-mannosyltransferase
MTLAPSTERSGRSMPVEDPQERTVSAQEAVASHRQDPVAPCEGTRQRRQPVWLLVLAGVLGFVVTGYLAVAGTSLGSTYVAPDLWFYENHPGLSPASIGLRRAGMLNTAALGLLAVSWMLVGFLLRRGAAVRSLMIVGGVWALPLVLGPPLFSPDVYSYTAIGAAIQHGVDPYLFGPAAAGEIPGVRGADPFWRDSPTPYSPPFLVLLSSLSRLFGEDLLQMLVAFRVLAVAAWAATAVMLARLAKTCGMEPARAVWLGVINPLVLISIVSANHNDALMLALVVPGLLLALAERPFLGVLLCAAGAGVKITALAAVALIAVDYAQRQTVWPARVRALVTSGAVGVAGFAVPAVVSGYGWGWVHNLSAPGQYVGPLTPTAALAVTIDPVRPPIEDVRLAGSIVGVVVGLLVLTRLRRWGLVRVTAWVLLIAVLVGPVVWAWYLLGSIVLFAAAGTSPERQLSVVCSVGLLFTSLPGGEPSLHHLPRPLAEHLALGTVVALIAWYGTASLIEARCARSRTAVAA